jgi:hypothetical protein
VITLSVGQVTSRIVSRSDLLRPFTRPDEEAHREVIKRIAEDILIVEPYRVDVAVSDGILRLDGRVARHSQAKLAGSPGVASYQAGPPTATRSAAARLPYDPDN